MSNTPTGVTLVPRQHKPAARNRALRYPTLAFQTGNADTEPGVPAHRPPHTAGRQADAITDADLTNRTAISAAQGGLDVVDERDELGAVTVNAPAP